MIEPPRWGVMIEGGNLHVFVSTPDGAKVKAPIGRGEVTMLDKALDPGGAMHPALSSARRTNYEGCSYSFGGLDK